MCLHMQCLHWPWELPSDFFSLPTSWSGQYTLQILYNITLQYLCLKAHCKSRLNHLDFSGKIIVTKGNLNFYTTAILDLTKAMTSHIQQKLTYIYF